LQHRIAADFEIQPDLAAETFGGSANDKQRLNRLSKSFVRFYPANHARASFADAIEADISFKSGDYSLRDHTNRV